MVDKGAAELGYLEKKYDNHEIIIKRIANIIEELFDNDSNSMRIWDEIIQEGSGKEEKLFLESEVTFGA